MDAVTSFLEMGGYAGFVWPAYGLSAVVLAGLALVSLRRLRVQQRALRDLDAATPTRSGSRSGS